MDGRALRDANEGEIETLEVESTCLLDELELAYRQMERLLGKGDHETRLAYQELRKRNQELLQRLAELGAAHQQLQAAQSMLVRSERMSAMGQMAAAIVHEINNPLSVIIGHVEMLLMDEHHQDKEVLQVIHHASSRLKALTRNVLSFSRKKQTDPYPLDLSSLADEILGFFLPLMRHIEVQADLVPGLPKVMADAAEIEQVLTNLIVNALDAMYKKPYAQLSLATGQRSIAAAIAAETAAGRAVRLAIQADPSSLHRECVFAEVRDMGPGIAPETMEVIFEAFFTTKSEEKGTGLGLAISRSIAESYQGNILVASALGAGASFWVFLPVSPGAGETC